MCREILSKSPIGAEAAIMKSWKKPAGRFWHIGGRWSFLFSISDTTYHP
jgi:hypothetical protein